MMPLCKPVVWPHWNAMYTSVCYISELIENEKIKKKQTKSDIASS